MALSVRKRIDDESFKKICANSNTMAKAATEMKLHFNSFKRRALELECYEPNQSGKGINRVVTPKIPLAEILEGKHPYFQTFKLKNRLLQEGLKVKVCESCKITEWNSKELCFELDHIDGNSTNHLLSNLRMLCPNYHSQTETYRSKNKSNKI